MFQAGTYLQGGLVDDLSSLIAEVPANPEPFFTDINDFPGLYTWQKLPKELSVLFNDSNLTKLRNVI